MVSEEIKSVLVDYQQRKMISSLLDLFSEEESFPEEEVWRKSHSQQHYQKEAMLILSGSHSVALNGRTYRGSANTLLLVNSREVHDSRYYPGIDDASHLWLIIKRDCVICQCDEVRNKKFNILFHHLYEDKEKIRMLHRIWEAAYAGVMEPQAAFFGISVIINGIFWDILSVSAPLLPQGTNTREAAIEKARHYIDSTWGKGCTLPFLAELTGYSTVHFQRLFEKYTGRNVREYIRLQRMLRYEEMRNYYPLKAIAEELGFSSASALCHFLEKVRDRK